jgi:AcrR family transcriptional regulator
VRTHAERPYHHGNLRKALLECAEQTLSLRGVRELSLRELAREVGVSHGAPRRHFADKQALLDALAEDGFERLGRALQDSSAGAGDSFDERFAAFARAYVAFATQHAALLELMFAGKHRAGATDSLREAADRAFAMPISLILEAQAAGEVVPGEPERVTTIAFAALHGMATLINAGMLDRAALDDLLADGVERLLVGLRPR